MATTIESQAWVTEVYRALLGRAPDSAGLQYWSAAMVSGIHTRGSVYQAILRTSETQKVLKERIRQAYRDVLGREGEESGINYWLSQIVNGKVGPELGHITQQFAQSAEANRNNPAVTPGTTNNPNTPTPDPTLPTNFADFPTPDIPRRDVSAEIGVILARYGLEGLADWAIGLIQQGEITSAELMLRLYDRPEFKARFPGLDQMRANGLPPMSPEEYMNYELQAHGLMRAAGLPEGFYDDPSDFTDFIGQGVSLAELGARIQNGYQRVLTAPPEVRARFAQWFGADGDAALASMFLDPSKSLPLLEQQLTQAEIAGSGDIYGIGIGQATAEQLAAMGYSGQTASTGFRQIQAQGAVFDESITENTDLTAEGAGVDAAFGLNQDSVDTINRRIQGRVGALSGGGGLAIDQQGIGGVSDQ